MSVYDTRIKSLMLFGGANGSTTFTDQSGKTWTAYGNAKISTAQYVTGGSSGYFDGSGDYIDTPDSDDWQLDGGVNTSKWRIDFWVRFTVDPGTGVVIFCGQQNDWTNFWHLRLDNNNLAFRAITAGTTVIDLYWSWNPAANIWYHVIVTKNGTSYKAYINDSVIGTTQTSTGVIGAYSAKFSMSGIFWTDHELDYPLNGYIDDFYIFKGTDEFILPISSGVSFISQGFGMI